MPPTRWVTDRRSRSSDAIGVHGVRDRLRPAVPRPVAGVLAWERLVALATVLAFGAAWCRPEV